jgi:hypothetical protein
MSNGYDYDTPTLLELFLKMQFPERNLRESSIIRDFLQQHIGEYDRYSFSVRVGAGLAPDPTHLPGVRRNTIFSTQKRIDMMAWQGPQPWIFEVKERLGPGTVGQLVTYSHLWWLENPDALEPRLGVIARYGDPDTERVLEASGIVAYFYEPAAGDGGNAGGGVPPVNSGAA